ncbi:MAG: winged helix-turn-helix domain-containing protein [Calditrichia bacterium]
MSSPITSYKFDDIIIDLRNRQLNRNGEAVTLNAKYFDVLAFLAGRPQQLISRDQLFREIWQGLIVTDSALSQCIKDIRKALGDDAKNPRYIKTFPKKGFMFLKTPISVSEKEPAVPQAQGIQTVVKRPYKFLDYYTEEDTDLFYGRESEVRIICSKILSHRSFILYGRSGVGKSSLVHAGLIPSLKRMGHLAFSVRSFYDPFEEMVRVLSGDTSSGENLDLYQLLQQRIASPEQNVIFILDQFEEFFTLTHPEARDNFFRNIGEVFRQNRIQLRLVFAVREDYLAEMNQFKHILPEIFHHEYRLQRLNREQAERAITEPARKVNCDLEPPLVQMILDDLSDDEFVDPPQLQIVCDALYDLKEVEGRIPLAGYRRLGGASQILSRYLERVVRRFNSEEIEMVRAILGALISAKNQRLILPLSRLQERVTYQSGDEAKIHSLVSELSDARIVRFRRQDGEIWVELTHDFLIPEISRWQSAELLALKQAHSLIERAVENYELHGLLMDDDTIDVISPLGSKLPLNENEAGLLARSMLNRARLIPEWLIRKFPSVTGLIQEAMRNEKPPIRICAIESAEYGLNDDLLSILKEMALWDPDLNVRKAASIALAERFGKESKRWLLDKNSQPSPGIIRKAISIAFIRDHNKMLIWLRRLPPHIVLLVLSGLMWVRLRRNKMDILKETIGGAAGAGAAGLLTGYPGAGIVQPGSPGRVNGGIGYQSGNGNHAVCQLPAQSLLGDSGGCCRRRFCRGQSACHRG